MRTDTKVSLGILAVVIAGSAYAFNYLQPNEGQARFRDDTITVNAEAAGVWGAETSQLREWGVPIEFVTGEADVTITIGQTKCFDVPGFGKACESAVALPKLNNRHWVESCTITLSDKGAGDTREATAILTHEFGHCLGAEHNESTPSIMAKAIPTDNGGYSSPNWSWHVTDADRASIPY